ncbi:response regulator transcription factor [Aneurinibacillus sp. BA2021]|nr:response regulator transcription factor [Aneurinibacillus sp. BA2021]
MKVLILEDEESIRSFIRVNVKRQGFDVVEAAAGEEALKKLEGIPDIAVALVDVMLPGMDGVEVCRILREKYPNIGIIILTAKTQEEDIVTGLEAGADDYICKPFRTTELMARIKSLLRRLPGEPEPLPLSSGPFRLFPKERKLLKGQQEIELTPKEFDLMTFFMENENRAVSRDDILNHVWGKFYMGDLKIVDVNIRRLRQKLENDPSEPAHIETIWGFGYRWKKNGR